MITYIPPRRRTAWAQRNFRKWARKVCHESNSTKFLCGLTDIQQQGTCNGALIGMDLLYTHVRYLSSPTYYLQDKNHVFNISIWTNKATSEIVGHFLAVLDLMYFSESVEIRPSCHQKFNCFFPGSYLHEAIEKGVLLSYPKRGKEKSLWLRFFQSNWF